MFVFFTRSCFFILLLWSSPNDAAHRLTASSTLGKWHWNREEERGKRWRGRKKEGGLVTFVSPSDGLVVWVACLEKFSCHCMIRQSETLYAKRMAELVDEKETRYNTISLPEPTNAEEKKNARGGVEGGWRRTSRQINRNVKHSWRRLEKISHLCSLFVCLCLVVVDVRILEVNIYQPQSRAFRSSNPCLLDACLSFFSLGESALRCGVYSGGNTLVPKYFHCYNSTCRWFRIHFIAHKIRHVFGL